MILVVIKSSWSKGNFAASPCIFPEAVLQSLRRRRERLERRLREEQILKRWEASAGLSPMKRIE